MVDDHDGKLPAHTLRRASGRPWLVPGESIWLVGAVAAAITGSGACNALFGVDELAFDGSAATSSGQGGIAVGGAGGDGGGVSCPSGMADCDDDLTTACETDTRSDIAHCGECDLACSLASSTPTCESGMCVAHCAEGFGDCDGDREASCETDLSTTLQHCGACDAPCPNEVNLGIGGVPCQASACQYPTSCGALLKAFPNAASGVYRLDPDGPTGSVAPFDAHCDMEDGVGWTLALKADGNLTTFARASTLWDDDVPYQADHPDLLDGVEAKLPSYWTMPVGRLLAMMVDPADSQPRPIIFELPTPYASLRDVFAQNLATNLSIDSWRGLLSVVSWQEQCAMQGFNRPIGTSQNVKGRLALVMNEQPDCESCDSWIGFGLDAAGGVWPSVGNFALGDPGTIHNNNRDTRAFGLLLVGDP